MRGLEPRTPGLEVLCAIQLRHMGSLLFYSMSETIFLKKEGTFSIFLIYSGHSLLT